MKIQALAVLSIVIILPMAILLNNYSTNQIKTLDFQVSYDNKLTNSTYDGVKSFQLNMTDVATTDSEADSKIRDITAAIQTFYKSLANHFEMTGYGEDVLNSYVPAVVYTLYDGYYIYSSYKNTLSKNDEFYYDDDTFKADNKEQYDDVDYKRYDPTTGEGVIYGLKPFIYYSQRYKEAGSYDVVITYTLDSFITIQGTIGTGSEKKNIYESGYLLSGVDGNVVGDDITNVTYKGIKIDPEINVQQNVFVANKGESTYPADKKPQMLSCRKINGQKYYADKAPDNGVFALSRNRRSINKKLF